MHCIAISKNHKSNDNHKLLCCCNGIGFHRFFRTYGGMFRPDNLIFFFLFFGTIFHRVVRNHFYIFPMHQFFQHANRIQTNDVNTERAGKSFWNSQKRIYFQTKRILDILWFIMQSLKLPKTTNDAVDEDEKKKPREWEWKKGTALTGPGGVDCRQRFAYINLTGDKNEAENRREKKTHEKKKKNDRRITSWLFLFRCSGVNAKRVPYVWYHDALRLDTALGFHLI